MTQYVTDANVIFACLISGKENYERMFTENKFLLPDFALVEIQNYQPDILRKTKMPFEALKKYTLEIFDRLIVVPNLTISNQSYFQAFLLCRDIDPKDTPYLALAIEFDLVLVTKDEELVAGLRRKGFEKVISLTEILRKQNA